MKNLFFTKNKTSIRKTAFALFLVSASFISKAQESVDLLKANYSGNVVWDASTSTMTFASTGTINFTNKATNYNDPYGGQTLQASNWMWNVPTTVQKIIIKKNVTVTGGFHTKGNITITGEDQNTSVLYGTPLQSWADKNNPLGQNLDEWYYCQIQVYGGVCNIQNLKILDPFSFAVRGWGPQINMKKVSVIDTRGGFGNHSDGFEGGDNSTVDSCYFETGDDNIKVYFKNLLVTNTEIKMVQNTVPIQFGWGNYNDNASATFENCKITGLAGRGSDMPIIDNAGSTQRNKTVVMNNCYLENTNGTIFRTAVAVAAPSAINVTINNSYVKAKKYESAGYNANGTRAICGTTNKLTFYDCRATLPTGKPNIWIHSDLTAVTSYPTINSSSTESVATTDVNSDPDDQVALSMYLMQANKFNTVGIVLGVTNRDTKVNSKTFFDNTFRSAYAADYSCLNKNIGGYPTPESFNVMESSLTSGSGYTTFNAMPDNKYDNYSSLPGSVKSLVDELKSNKYSASNPLYVLIWGGLQEVAIAVKHLQHNNNTAALNNLFVVSHWTTSFTNQGSPTDPFAVANCNSGKEACTFMHDEAKKSGAAFKFVDLGSIGQSGIVSGYGNWFTGGLNGAKAQQFKKSKLGDLMIKSKFVFGKPDGSDCGSYYTVLGTYGVKLSDFTIDGALTQAQEVAGTNTYLGTAKSMLDELLTISDKSFGCVITAVETELEEQSISVYPNPATSQITISGLKNEDEWTLYNFQGIELAKGKGNIINLDEAENGILFLSISGKRFKIIKQ